MDTKSRLSRRNFLKRLGLGASAAAAAVIAGCNSADNKLTSKHTASETAPSGGMTYRTNPKTGDQVSLLGYGCMRWPEIEGSDGELDQEAINHLVDTALNAGVNYFDTSPAYCRGMSEHATGIALSRHPRDSYFIATKLSNFAPSTWSRQASIDMYHKSLRELQTDYIDYMLLHAIGTGDGMEEFRKRYIDNGILDFLLAEREAGRIRNLGFSYHGDIKVFDYLLSEHDRYKWDFVQIQLNYLDWNHAKEVNPNNTDASYLYAELTKRGIPAVIMEPLLGGRLAKLPQHISTRLQERDPDRSIASWAFRYAGTAPGVLTVLSGMTCMEHLNDNLRSFSPLVPLTDDDTALLYSCADMMMEYPTVPCNDCKYCMPCPYGIDIPSILLHYNKCINEGTFPDDRRSPEYAASRRAFLIGYDRSVPRLRQASHCIGCGQCAVHCPQSIDIPRELHHIDAFVESLKQKG